MTHFAKLCLRSVLLCVFSVFLITLSGNVFGQTNPTTSNLPVTISNQTGTTLPSFVAVHRFATVITSRVTTDGSADLPNTSTNNSGGWIAQGVDGISLLASGTNPAGAIITEINTTGFINVQVSWIAWTVLDQASRTNSIALQYRVGESGTWINVDSPSSSVYATGTVGRVNGVAFTQNLPVAAENKPIVQVRWIYWESISTGGGSRDRLGIDEISINGSSTSPFLSVSPTSILNFNYVEGSGPSSSINYNLSGGNLIPASGDITVTAPTDFEVSTSSNGTFTDNLLVPYTGGMLASTPIFVRLKSGLVLGNYGGTGINVTNALGSLNANVNVRGAVSCGIATNISTVRASVPVPVITPPPSFTVSGIVTAVFGSSKFYIQDATGGIAVFATSIVDNNSIALGDQIRLTGTPVRFNGEAQINSITCFLKTGTASVPTPIEFNPNTTSLNAFMCANEGSFVKIPSSNFTATGTFTTGTGAGNNYSIFPCNAQDATEIRVDPNSGTLIGSTIPTVTQDITGVLGRFVQTNTSGVNTADKLQLFPRNLSDLSVSGTPCAAPGACAVTTFVDSPTKLDVINWNVEWLGHPTMGPTNKALQQTNAQTVLNGVGADIYMLQEICQYNPSNPSDNTTSFGKLIEGLNTTFGVGTYSGECSSAVSTSFVDPNAQRVCIIYKNSVVTKVFSRPMFNGFTPATYPPTGTPSQFWASGRKPFMFMAKVNINAQMDTILLVGLHAKAGAALDDYARRKYDVRAMYDTLQAQYPNRKTIVIGDLNDDIDKSISSLGCNQLVSSYAPFLYANPNETVVAGTRPNASWTPISKTLSDSFCASTVSFPDYIDHQIVSNEMVGTFTGYRYVPGSINSFRPVITNYSTTTSDHYATVARYEYIAPPIVSIVPTGNWSSQSTWNCNCVPTSANDVIIETGHTVTVDAASQAKTLNLKGTLNYISVFTLSLGM